MPCPEMYMNPLSLNAEIISSAVLFFSLCDVAARYLAKSITGIRNDEGSLAVVARDRFPERATRDSLRGNMTVTSDPCAQLCQKFVSKFDDHVYVGPKYESGLRAGYAISRRPGFQVSGLICTPFNARFPDTRQRFSLL